MTDLNSIEVLLHRFFMDSKTVDVDDLDSRDELVEKYLGLINQSDVEQALVEIKKTHKSIHEDVITDVVCDAMQKLTLREKLVWVANNLDKLKINEDRDKIDVDTIVYNYLKEKLTPQTIKKLRDKFLDRCGDEAVLPELYLQICKTDEINIKDSVMYFNHETGKPDERDIDLPQPVEWFTHIELLENGGSLPLDYMVEAYWGLTEEQLIDEDEGEDESKM